MSGLSSRLPGRFRWFPAVLVLALAACTGTPGQTPGVSTSVGPASNAPSLVPTPVPTVETRTIRYAFIAPNELADAPIYVALEKMKELGYKVEVSLLNGSELVTAGLAEGQFDLANGSIASTLAAIQQGADMKVISGRLDNQWQLWTASDITTCAGMHGQRFAIGSEGSTSAAMARAYIASTCAGTQPEYIIIAGSDARSTALLSGEIDVTTQELADALELASGASTSNVHQLVNFSETLPDLLVTSVAANGDFLRENPDTIRQFTKELLLAFRQVASDKAFFEQAMRTHVAAEINEATFEDAVDAYPPFFPVNGALTQESVAYTIEFFTEQGDLEPGLKPEDVVDTTQLEAVLDEIGRQ